MLKNIKNSIINLTDNVKSWYFWVGVVFAISVILVLKDIAIMTQTQIFTFSINSTFEMWRIIFFIIMVCVLIISIIMVFYAYSETHKSEILFNTLIRILIGMVIVFIVEWFYKTNAVAINEKITQQ